MSRPIILYDGVCGLCNRAVRFVLRRDHDAAFQFASLQSSLAAKVLVRHGVNPSDLDTVYVVQNYASSEETLLSRSDAVNFILRGLRNPWTAIARIAAQLPRPLRDWSYRLIARHRYRVFGRYESCPLPPPDARSRFLDE